VSAVIFALVVAGLVAAAIVHRCSRGLLCPALPVLRPDPDG